MRNIRRWLLSSCAVLVLLSLETDLHALDAYQDRRGVFGGFGMGGGLVFEGSAPGGGAVLDVQLGGGATRNLTLAMDIDFWFQADKDDVRFLINPGPELTYFFGETGLFIRPGIAAALVMVWPDEDDFDFRGGFEIGFGFGWEFFINASVAMGLTMEGEYIILPGVDDIAGVSFLFTLKRY